MKVSELSDSLIITRAVGAQTGAIMKKIKKLLLLGMTLTFLSAFVGCSRLNDGYNTTNDPTRTGTVNDVTNGTNTTQTTRSTTETRSTNETTYSTNPTNPTVDDADRNRTQSTQEYSDPLYGTSSPGTNSSLIDDIQNNSPTK
ncbi:MAG: hypothetical protein LBM69_07725 [Lachnospiraceae bacterium]|nr:hypothetical protein [Lachnospiraceae bacterium]